MSKPEIQKTAERFDAILRKTNPESGCTREEQRTAAEMACKMLREQPMVIMPTESFVKLKDELTQRRRAMAPRVTVVHQSWHSGWQTSGTASSTST